MAIKLIDPNAVVRLISIQDEAVDLENSDVKAYGNTLNLKHIKFLEGMTPTFFLTKNINPITQAEINEVHYQFTPVGNDKTTGKPLPPQVDVVSRGSMMVKYFTEGVKQIEENGVARDFVIAEIPGPIIQEIGSYVMTRSNLGDDQKKS